MMEKCKNKKGFTLIELIVVIAIVAALSISMGVNSVQTLKETRIKNYKETYISIFNAATLYSKLKAPKEVCSKDGSIKCKICDFNEYPYCDIPLCCLTSNGLLDEELFDTNDPLVVLGKSDISNITFETGVLTENSVNFYLSQNIKVYYDDDNVLHVSMKNRYCADDDYIDDENIDNYENWEGEC